jgi:hypothetical protein
MGGDVGEDLGQRAGAKRAVPRDGDVVLAAQGGRESEVRTA